MARPSPGEVWLVDLGMAAKVRPCLILSDYPAPDELALIVLVPHTTAVRGNRWEFPLSKNFLKPGAFHLQQVQPVSLPRLERRLGFLSEAEFRDLRAKLAALLHLTGDCAEPPEP
jgi:mRNA interferase MazF